MTGPKRLFSDDEPMLVAAREDAPPGDLEARILAGLGGAPPPTTPSGGKLALKLGIGGAIGVGAIALILRAATPAPPTPEAARPALVVAESPPVPTEEAKEEPTPPVEEQVVAPEPSAKPVVAIRARPATPAPVSSGGLGAEIKALDAARSAMNGGDAKAALASLDAYDRAFPQGTLKQEAALLRIDALMRAGRTEEARKRGHAFLSEHPTTPHKKRILTLLRESE